MHGARVAFLTDAITPYMVAVLAELSRLVDLHALFCSERGSRTQDWSLADGLPFRYKAIGGLILPREDETDIQVSPRIILELARSRPDAVISGSFGVPTLYASIYTRARRIPLLVYSDGTKHSEAQIGPIQRATRAYLSQAADGAVANSRPAGQRFAELGFPRQRIFHALHATDVRALAPLAANRTYDRADELRLLSTGRLIPRKGLDRLMRALSVAQKRRDGISLSLVGAGPEEQRLRELAIRLGLGDVAFQGFLDQAALPKVYEAADAYVFPTLDDPFGIVVLEAAAAGLPIIASPRAGATLDLLRDGESALVRDPDDIEGMAEAIVRLRDDVALRERLGRAARAATADRTPAAAAAGYADAVTTVIAGNGIVLR